MATLKNEWVKRRWSALMEEFGGRCMMCGTIFDLEFAHINPTKCKGEGRGKSRRLSDIMRHPLCYVLLCMVCHDRQDGRTPRKRQPDIRKTMEEIDLAEYSKGLTEGAEHDE